MISEEVRAIEAILMVATDPVEPHLLAQLLEISPARVEDHCAWLAQSYADHQRGFTLVKVAGGYRLQSHPDLAPYVERFVLEGQSARLSAPALETLAIVAYKQPVSRAQVAAIRGVNPDGVLRTLLQRGYIEEAGRDPGPGQAVLYATTQLFLERLGLDTIDQLPLLGDFVPGPEVMDALEQGLRHTPATGVPADAVDDGDEGADAGVDTEDPAGERSHGENREGPGAGAGAPDVEAAGLPAAEGRGVEAAGLSAGGVEAAELSAGEMGEAEAGGSVVGEMGGVEAGGLSAGEMGESEAGGSVVDEVVADPGESEAPIAAPAVPDDAADAEAEVGAAPVEAEVGAAPVEAEVGAAPVEAGGPGTVGNGSDGGIPTGVTSFDGVGAARRPSDEPVDDHGEDVIDLRPELPTPAGLDEEDDDVLTWWDSRDLTAGVDPAAADSEG